MRAGEVGIGLHQRPEAAFGIGAVSNVGVASFIYAHDNTSRPELSGKIDAEVSVYNNELVAWRIEHPELKLRHWTMSSLGFDTPGYAIITSEDLLKQKPQVAAAFRQATVKGIEYAVSNPAEAVQILTKAVPELKVEVETAKWEATIPVTRGPATQGSSPP